MLIAQLTAFNAKPELTGYPQNNLGRVHRYPHVRECTLPLRVLAVLCATLQNCYRSNTERYRAITEQLRNRQHLRSASRHFVTVPRFRRTTFGRRSFSVGGPMAWNALPDNLRDPSHSSSSFRRDLKTALFTRY